MSYDRKQKGIDSRGHNEILVSRPKIQGIFAYNKEYKDVPKYLRQYAVVNDLPIILFGK